MIIQKVSGTIAGILELSKITNWLLHMLPEACPYSFFWSAEKIIGTITGNLGLVQKHMRFLQKIESLSHSFCWTEKKITGTIAGIL